MENAPMKRGAVMDMEYVNSMAPHQPVSVIFLLYASKDGLGPIIPFKTAQPLILQVVAMV
jgi:hypothetical protein